MVRRVLRGPQTFFSTHSNQLPLLSGVHGLNDFLYSVHILGSFDGRIYNINHFPISVNLSIKGSKKIGTTEKILQTMYSWEFKGLSVVFRDLLVTIPCLYVYPCLNLCLSFTKKLFETTNLSRQSLGTWQQMTTKLHLCLIRLPFFMWESCSWQVCLLNLLHRLSPNPVR